MTRKHRFTAAKPLRFQNPGLPRLSRCAQSLRGPGLGISPVSVWVPQPRAAARRQVRDRATTAIPMLSRTKPCLAYKVRCSTNWAEFKRGRRTVSGPWIWGLRTLDSHVSAYPNCSLTGMRVKLTRVSSACCLTCEKANQAQASCATDGFQFPLKHPRSMAMGVR